MSRFGVRWRLTVWYGLSLVLLLSMFGGLVYRMVDRRLLDKIDEVLQAESDELAEAILRTPDRGELLKKLHEGFDEHEEVEFQVVDAVGVVFRSARVGESGIPVTKSGRGDGEAASSSENVPGLGRCRIREVIIGTKGGPTGLAIQAARSLDQHDRSMRQLLFVMFGAGAPALLLAVVGGYFLASRSLAPVDRLSAEASAIHASDLSKRLPVPIADDELGRLSRTLNELIGRLEKSFAEVRRFTGDAAHELRTPLAVMRSTIEVALRRPRDAQEHERTLAVLLDEVRRLTRLADDLLFLSRQDSSALPIHRIPVRLDELAADVVQPLSIMASEAGLELSLVIANRVEVVADPDQVRRIVINLVDNAVQNTPAGGSITISVESAGPKRARLVVRDTGRGIPAEHLDRIFDRFHRVDPARNVDSEGGGLGLSICQAIAKAHGGQLSVRSELGSGSEFIFEIPADSKSDPVLLSSRVEVEPSPV